jgi:signal transduction histidine kinase
MNIAFQTPPDAGRKILFRLRWKVLGFVALCHVLLFALALQADGGAAPTTDWWLQVLVLLTVSLGLTILYQAFRDSKAAGGFLVFQGFVLAVAAYPQGRNLGVVCLILIICVTELSFWLVRSEWEVVGITLVFAALLGAHPLPAFGADLATPRPVDLLALLLAAGLALGAAFTVRHYLVKTALQERDLQDLRNSLASLLGANLDLQNYAMEVGEHATVLAFQRLTRDIHDGVGYIMMNLRMMLEAATDLSSGENRRLRGLLEQAKEEVQNGLSETRQALRAFREIDKVKAEGIRYIHKLLNSFSNATGIAVEVTYGNIPWSFGEELNVVIYRILQESMTNAIRHGHASRIQVYFWISGGKLHITVDDNGKGSANVTPGIGFKGMKERLEPFGGQFDFGNGFSGFTLRVEIPWPRG